jgi:hypothetical protein
VFRPAKDFYTATRADVVRRDEAKMKLAEGRPLSPEKQTVGQFLARWLEEVVRPNVSAKSDWELKRSWEARWR